MSFLIKEEKTNWKYILIVVVLAVLVSGGILGYMKYFIQEMTLLTKFPELKKPEKVIENETANWKTYRDNFFNFEIKYPSDWEYSNKDESTFAGLIFLRPILKEPLSAFPPEYSLITINVSKGNLKDIESYINSQCLDKIKCSEIKDMVLGGLFAKSFKSAQFYPQKFVVLQKKINDPAFKEVTVAFSLRLDKAFNEIYSEDQKNSVFDQILSTFKFLE